MKNSIMDETPRVTYQTAGGQAHVASSSGIFQYSQLESTRREQNTNSEDLSFSHYCSQMTYIDMDRTG